MSDKELWGLMSIICEGQDSEQRREVEQYITDLQKEIDRLGKLFYERNEENIRLNNIINELENWLNEKICLNKNDKDYINGMTFVGVNLQMYQMFLDKLQELKGSDKE